MKNLLDIWMELFRLPAPDRHTWLEGAENGISFLKESFLRQEEIVLYANGPHAFAHSVLVPTQSVSPPDKEDLLGSHITLKDTWCIQRIYGGGEGHQIRLERPLDSSICKTMVDGEKLIFLRRFEGVEPVKSELEISQKLVHSLELYFVEERQAYCRLDNKGDIESVIRIYEDKTDDPDQNV